MLYYYADIKWIHVAAVLTTGLLFFARGVGMWIGSPIGMSASVRYVSYAVDTTLLTAALMLTTLTHQSPLAQPWLATKIVLLVAYIALGSMALKRGTTLRSRRTSFIAAIACYGYILSVALTREPLGFFERLAR
jgi:uncharacterized membrane protein SirB2